MQLMAEGAPRGLVLLHLKSQCLNQLRTQWAARRRETWLPPSALGQEGCMCRGWVNTAQAVRPVPRQKAEESLLASLDTGRAGGPDPSL